MADSAENGLEGMGIGRWILYFLGSVCITFAIILVAEHGPSLILEICLYVCYYAAPFLGCLVILCLSVYVGFLLFAGDKKESIFSCALLSIILDFISYTSSGFLLALMASILPYEGMFSAVPLFATGTCISLFLYGFFCCALIIYVFFLKFTMGFSFSRAALICIFPVAIRIFVAWYLLVSYLLPPLGDISTACGIAEEGRPIVFAIYKYEKRNDVWPLSLADISPENTSKDYMQSWTYSSSENFWCLSRALKKSANEMHEQPVPPNTPSVSFTFGIPDRPTRWILGYGRDNDWSLDVDQPIPNEDSK